MHGADDEYVEVDMPPLLEHTQTFSETATFIPPFSLSVVSQPLLLSLPNIDQILYDPFLFSGFNDTGDDASKSVTTKGR